MSSSEWIEHNLESYYFNGDNKDYSQWALLNELLFPYMDEISLSA